VTKPYVVCHHGREDIYIQVGSTSRLATREQQARLYAVGGMLQAERLPVSGSGLRDLSRNRLTDYLATTVGDNMHYRGAGSFQSRPASFSSPVRHSLDGL